MKTPTLQESTLELVRLVTSDAGSPADLTKQLQVLGEVTEGQAALDSVLALWSAALDQRYSGLKQHDHSALSRRILSAWTSVEGQLNQVRNPALALELLISSLSTAKSHGTQPLELEVQVNTLLAHAYSFRLHGSPRDNLEQALELARLALDQLQGDRVTAAQINTLLVVIYSNRLVGSRNDNVEQAILAGKRALEVFTQEDFPQQWAIVHLRLGVAYKDRLLGSRQQNIEAAIDCYQQALKVHTLQASPEMFAGLSMNLGNAFLELESGSKASNIEFAIANFQASLQIFTKPFSPLNWARVQLNLGNALLERVQGQRSANIESAIQSYTQAIQEFESISASSMLATALLGYSNAMRNRIAGNRSDNLETALQAQQQVLSACSRAENAHLWAGAQVNLGNVYLERIVGSKADNVALANECYNNALQVFTKDYSLEIHESVKRNLALVTPPTPSQSESKKASSSEVPATTYRELLTRTERAERDVDALAAEVNGWQTESGKRAILAEFSTEVAALHQQNLKLKYQLEHLQKNLKLETSGHH